MLGVTWVTLVTCITKNAWEKMFPPPCKWQWTGVVRGGPREKLIKSLLRGRMIFFYHVNRFFTVCLLLYYLPNKTVTFKEKLSQKMQFLAQTSALPWCLVQVFVRRQTNVTMSSFTWSTKYTQSTREDIVWLFPIFTQSNATFVLKKRSSSYSHQSGEKKYAVSKMTGFIWMGP